MGPIIQYRDEKKERFQIPLDSQTGVSSVSLNENHPSPTFLPHLWVTICDVSVVVWSLIV